MCLSSEETCTLDLGGLHVYTRSAQIEPGGRVIGGTLSQVTGGGAIVLDHPTAGQVLPFTSPDDWTFFGRAGQAVTVSVDPGSGGPASPVAPTLDYVRIQLQDEKCHDIANSASSITVGAVVTIPGAQLPADGVYHVRVAPPADHASSAGNYTITVWNATTRDNPLPLDETQFGQIESSYRVDHWNFSAQANQQVQFTLLSASSPAIQFRLDGPGGVTVFSAQTTSVGPLTLPSSGTYTLTVSASANQVGSYAFRLDPLMISDLTLGVPASGTIAGSGEAQLFRVRVTDPAGLLVTLTDSAATDRNELYVKFGAPPTRSDFQVASDGPAGPGGSVLIPTAQPGDWYILLYSDSAPTPGAFTLLAATSGLVLTSITPDHYSEVGSLSIVPPEGAPYSQAVTMTLTGRGFDAATTVQFIAADGTIYPAGAVRFDLPTQLTATIFFGLMPPGTYTVRVSRPTANRPPVDLPGAFRVTSTEPGLALGLLDYGFHTDLIVPDSIGYHQPAVIEIDFHNTRDEAIQTPLLILKANQMQKDGTERSAAIMTLDPTLVTQGLWSNTLPPGFSSAITILPGGKFPGVLQPGVSGHVLVYYAGWVKPWDLDYPPISFELDSVGLSSEVFESNPLTDAARPDGIAPDAWAKFSQVYFNDFLTDHSVIRVILATRRRRTEFTRRGWASRSPTWTSFFPSI